MLNMLAVWALTGIWHGANWNFICWGLYYFVLLVIEKNFLMKYLKKRQGLAAHLHIVPGGAGLGAVHLQRPRCTAGAAAQPVVHPAGRRFGAVFPAQLCGATGCVLRLLHPTAGTVLAVVQRQSPATGSALRRLLCSVHGVCGSSNGFHRTVCKLLRGRDGFMEKYVHRRSDRHLPPASLIVFCRLAVRVCTGQPVLAQARELGAGKPQTGANASVQRKNFAERQMAG